MRIVSWNMAYWKPNGFNSVANRQRQWSYLMALSPDIALLQECRPTDLVDRLPGWASDEYQILGEIPDKWTACSAVIARKELKPRFVRWDEEDGCTDPESRWLRYLQGYVARAEVELPGLGPLRVASVHAVAKEITDDDVLDDEQVLTADQHRDLCRGSIDRAWHNDLAAFALRGWLGDRFVVGGDWNTARAFDDNYSVWGDAGREFFEALAGWGWCETLGRHYVEETQTYLDADSYPYELDHVFTDRATHRGLRACKVIRAAPLAELSDHAAIVADYELGEN